MSAEIRLDGRRIAQAIRDINRPIGTPLGARGVFRPLPLSREEVVRWLIAEQTYADALERIRNRHASIKLGLTLYCRRAERDA